MPHGSIGGLRIALVWAVVCLECSCNSTPFGQAANSQAKTSMSPVHLPDRPTDYYPSEALRLKQEGIVVVRVCVGADSKVDGQVTVVSGSGNFQLPTTF